MPTIEELLMQGAALAEQAVLDSKAIDYAHLQGKEQFRALIDRLATRNPFIGNSSSGPAPGQQPAA